MSIGFSIAIRAVPFFDLLDKEEESLAAQVLEARGGSAANVAMDTSRRRLAQGIDAFARSLPTRVRSDMNTSRWAAYALAGLVDERMLHHPAGGLDRWREHLLEFELYGSALAGQEIVDRARTAAFGTMTATDFADDRGDPSLLAPLYLGLFRSGFEGALRGDISGLASLITSLEETVGAGRQVPDVITADMRPTRVGLSSASMAVIGVTAWLVGGAGFWMMLSQDALEEAERIEERVLANLPVATGAPVPLEHSIGPSGLPPLERDHRLKPASEDE